jgi:imidazolonepropionase-like amidohydrolase
MRIIILLFLCFSVCVNAQELSPKNGTAQSKASYYALTNATIYVSPTVKIEKGTILIKDDKIVETGKMVKIPQEAVVIDCDGKTIMPAFIETNTNLGLPAPTGRRHGNSPQLETSKKGAYHWNETIHPEVNAVDSYTFDEEKCKQWLQMGFGMVSTHINDGIMRGTGTLVSLGKSNYNKQILKSESAAYFSFKNGNSSQTYPSSQMGSIALLRQTFYDQKWYQSNQNKELNLSLEALTAQMKLPLFFQTDDKLEILRVAKIGKEFNLNFAYIGCGNEYEIIPALKKLNGTLVLPINFPDAFEVKDPYIAKQIPLSDLKNWELAPSNPYLLRKEGINIILSATGNATPADFWKNIQKAISRGLTAEEALRALTVAPAELLGIQAEFGTLENGKKASFVIYDNNPFMQEATLLESWLLGEQNILVQKQTNDIRGKYNALIDGETIPFEITGTIEKPAVKFKTLVTKTDTITKISKTDTISTNCFSNLIGNDLTIQFNSKNAKWDGSVNLHAKVNTKVGVFEGDGTLPDGRWIIWTAIRNKLNEKPDEKKPFKLDSLPLGKPWFPNLAYGFDSIPTKQTIFIQNATLWTNEAEGIVEKGNVLVVDGKIKFVGKETPALPPGTITIDATGKHVTSGIIDEHSHIAISKGVNESGQSITAEVSIADVVKSDDINIYRQLSGGVTAAQLLHGSANPIGGQSALIKLKWGHTPEEMVIPNAPKFIKFALGENVKQANWGDENSVRFPQTRMGVEQVFYDGFERARKYQADKINWLSLSEKKRTQSGLQSPRFDLELEVLSEILKSERFITCHSYVQSEINMLMHVADSMGFKINTFTHILEGYKVADKMKKHGVGASTFADWWAYKFEVNDAIPYNAAIMNQQGIVTAINSDDAEMGRRLNQEAAKTVKYGGVSEIDAWKMVTLNPAKLLHLDNKMGSLKIGKDADIVIWSTNPLSIEAKVEKTIIDGEVLYDAERDLSMRTRNASEKARIISKMLMSNEKGEPSKAFEKKKRKEFHCNTIGEEGSEGANDH